MEEHEINSTNIKVEEFNPQDMLLKIDTKQYLEVPKYKSTMHIGNIVINNIKHFNWLQKIFWRILLGIKIEDIKE